MPQWNQILLVRTTKILERFSVPTSCAIIGASLNGSHTAVKKEVGERASGYLRRQIQRYIFSRLRNDQSSAEGVYGSTERWRDNKVDIKFIKKGEWGSRKTRGEINTGLKCQWVHKGKQNGGRKIRSEEEKIIPVFKMNEKMKVKIIF